VAVHSSDCDINSTPLTVGRGLVVTGGLVAYGAVVASTVAAAVRCEVCGWLFVRYCVVVAATVHCDKLNSVGEEACECVCLFGRFVVAITPAAVAIPVVSVMLLL